MIDFKGQEIKTFDINIKKQIDNLIFEPKLQDKIFKFFEEKKEKYDEKLRMNDLHNKYNDKNLFLYLKYNKNKKILLQQNLNKNEINFRINTFEYYFKLLDKFERNSKINCDKTFFTAVKIFDFLSTKNSLKIKIKEDEEYSKNILLIAQKLAGIHNYDDLNKDFENRDFFPAIFYFIPLLSLKYRN
jgi:hypothetical protein